jgi:hypothetical protein
MKIKLDPILNRTLMGETLKYIVFYENLESDYELFEKISEKLSKRHIDELIPLVDGVMD